ncbi:MAG: hypothetical protein IPJ74_08175 [Saprospiraceae bacterium]|nr:hypothetical protein [Saprospiraceae bacterium]
MTLAANASEIYAVIPLESLLQNTKKEETLLTVRLERGDSLIARTNHYFALPKNLALKTPVIDLQVNEENQTIRLRANTLVKGLYLFTENDVRFEDNYFDLLPNESVTIPYKGDLRKEDLQFKFL